MAKVDILLGLQWGDEGKGKVVDFLSPEYDIIARFQGGPNAGHTLEFEGKKHVLHQIPSGIFRPGKMNIIGNGVVLDPITFKKEIEALAPYQLDIQNSLLLSSRAQMIVPTHRLLDQAYELSKGDAKIGSTLRGIGPAYQDKMARISLRIGDVLANDFNEKYRVLKNRHLEILKNYPLEFDLSALEQPFFEAIESLRKYKIVNTEYYINEQLKNGKTILAEGAQGSLLDIDFGSFPFVTSSNTIAAGACTGLGIAPNKIGDVFGIFKAYCTRVGSGPFPTELHGEKGEHLRKLGNEFGATTGRPRRCGWLDMPALQYAIMLSGVTQLLMMKVDVLSKIDEIQVCKGYRSGETITSEFPSFDHHEQFPVYQTFKTWPDNYSTNPNELSKELKEYIGFIQNYTDVPVKMVSFGPDRTQTIKLL